MKSDNQNKYAELCGQNPSIPIFSKDWWLDAVAGEENWNVALAADHGEIVGSLPYCMRKNRWGEPSIVMPPLTQTLGPWLKYPRNNKLATQLSFEKQVMAELIQQLPEVRYFQQNFHYSITNWLPYYWKGFEQTTRYTYLIDHLQDLDDVFGRFDKKLAGDIRKAEKDLKVAESDDIESYYQINQLTFEKQHKNIPYDISIVKKIDGACKKHNCRKIYFAIDQNSDIHAVLYLIWYEESAYYLMGGMNPKFQSRGAMSFLLREAIRFASTITNRFDFEGSMMETVERFFRSFGAKQMPYFAVTREEKSFRKMLVQALSKRLGLAPC